MKVLQVIPFFTPTRGGTVDVVYQLSKSLANNSHEVVIVTTDFEYDKNFSKSLERYGIRIIPFHCIANVGLFLISPSIKKWLSKHIREYDIIHMQNFRSYQNNIIYYYATKYNVPYVLQAHGSVLRIVEKQNLKRFYDLVWGDRLLKNAASVIAVSNKETQQYAEMGVRLDKIRLIANGINMDKMTTIVDNSFKKRFNIEDDKRVILYAGRIHRRKGLEYLILSFSLAIKEMSNIILVIVGKDDGYKKSLVKIVDELGIKEKVIFIDYIGNVSAAYQAADVVVYAAHYEIFGLVPFEAILCDTPVIVTDDCGCGEIIRMADCGYLVKYSDVEGLKEMIVHVLNNKDEAKDTVFRGQNYIRENLSWDKIVLKIEECYESCLCNV